MNIWYLGLFFSIFIFVSNFVFGHETLPSIAKIHFKNDTVVVGITTNIEIFLAGIDASVIDDTSDAPEAKFYDEARLMTSSQLKQAMKDNETRFLNKLSLKAGDKRLDLRIEDIQVEEESDLELPRLTRIRVSTNLPSDESYLTFSWERTLGALVIRTVSDENMNEEYAAWLQPGEQTDKIFLTGRTSKSSFEILGQYIYLGATHIIPKGRDHIVFILGLFFFSNRLRPLIGQITVFTIAHTVTLLMASFGLLNISPSFVEPLIALSIVWIGIENIFRPKLGISRLAVIFIFGLLHGLGFALVLGDIGLAGSSFVISLLAFNIGVELGQLIVLTPFILCSPFIAFQTWYRSFVAIPASSLIALIGVYWVFERLIIA